MWVLTAKRALVKLVTDFSFAAELRTEGRRTTQRGRA